MMRLLSILWACFLLAGCGVAAGGVASTPPPSAGPVITAPLRSTNADEQAVKLAFDSAEALLTAIDGLVAARIIIPGSPRALAIAGALKRTKAALNAAQLAQRVGNATSYEAAIADARAAFDQAQAAIKEIRR